MIISPTVLCQLLQNPKRTSLPSTYYDMIDSLHDHALRASHIDTLFLKIQQVVSPFTQDLFDNQFVYFFFRTNAEECLLVLEAIVKLITELHRREDSLTWTSFRIPAVDEILRTYALLPLSYFKSTEHQLRFKSLMQSALKTRNLDFSGSGDGNDAFPATMCPAFTKARFCMDLVPDFPSQDKDFVKVDGVPTSLDAMDEQLANIWTSRLNAILNPSSQRKISTTSTVVTATTAATCPVVASPERILVPVSMPQQGKKQPLPAQSSSKTAMKLDHGGALGPSATVAVRVKTGQQKQPLPKQTTHFTSPNKSTGTGTTKAAICTPSTVPSSPETPESTRYQYCLEKESKRSNQHQAGGQLQQQPVQGKYNCSVPSQRKRSSTSMKSRGSVKGKQQENLSSDKMRIKSQSSKATTQECSYSLDVTCQRLQELKPTSDTDSVIVVVGRRPSCDRRRTRSHHAKSMTESAKM